MNKKRFNKLSISEQVKYFNIELDNGNNIQQICKSINISYSTIKCRFKRHNYIYSKIYNKYESVDALVPVSNISENLVNEIINSLHARFTKLKCEKRESDLVSRSFRIHSCVLDDFIKFCNESDFTQQDILSQFIADGINKYSKNS